MVEVFFSINVEIPSGPSAFEAFALLMAFNTSWVLKVGPFSALLSAFNFLRTGLMFQTDVQRTDG